MSVGVTFGFTNGIITMLSLITGLYATNVNRVGIIGAILALLITDPLSDAYSMYNSQKLINKETALDIGKTAFVEMDLWAFRFELDFRLGHGMFDRRLCHDEKNSCLLNLEGRRQPMHMCLQRARKSNIGFCLYARTWCPILLPIGFRNSVDAQVPGSLTAMWPAWQL